MGTSSRASERTAAAGLPFVSVVVPVFNAANEIGRLIESLIGMDYPADRLELIVVDNGSTDGTDQVIEAFPVTLLRETRVQSSYAARNRGVAEASGEWVAFTDADCVVSSDWLRNLLSPTATAATGAVAGEVRALELETPVQRLTERFGLMKHSATMHHKKLACFSTANVAIRKEVLSALGGFREDIRFFGDMELSWRMQLDLQRELAFRPRAIVLHRHRRTLGDLWRQGCQHGRGVAFMKKTYPDIYRIDPSEQAGRIRGLVRAAGTAIRGSVGDDRDRDRWYAPLFLAVWYLGLGAGYLRGPARSPSIDR